MGGQCVGGWREVGRVCLSRGTGVSVYLVKLEVALVLRRLGLLGRRCEVHRLQAWGVDDDVRARWRRMGTYLTVDRGTWMARSMAADRWPLAYSSLASRRAEKAPSSTANDDENISCSDMLACTQPEAEGT